jgi:hypothetical protein
VTAAVVPLDLRTLAGDGPRADAWDAVRTHLGRTGWEIVAGLSGEPWCKAAAVADALAAVPDADPLVVHDADVLVPADALGLAVAAVETGAAWAVPHRLVHRYGQRSTRLLYGPSPSHMQEPTLERWPYDGIVGGGVVVLRRETYDVCPLDSRFVGWGGEDESWGWALRTLYGEPVRGDATLVHLWHPHATGIPSQRVPGRPARLESAQLRLRYRSALGDPARMRALVATIPG